MLILQGKIRQTNNDNCKDMINFLKHQYVDMKIAQTLLVYDRDKCQIFSIHSAIFKVREVSEPKQLLETS
jgi:hypothetical protein